LQSVKDKARSAMFYIQVEVVLYEDVKKQVLSYFQKTPDYFHDTTLTDLYEPTAFVKDIQNYLTTWLSM
jgi:hypothetical protein